jgi:hypothetical protein
MIGKWDGTPCGAEWLRKYEHAESVYTPVRVQDLSGCISATGRWTSGELETKTPVVRYAGQRSRTPFIMDK